MISDRELTSWYFKDDIFDFHSSFLERKEKLQKIMKHCFKLENNIPNLAQNYFSNVVIYLYFQI